MNGKSNAIKKNVTVEMVDSVMRFQEKIVQFAINKMCPHKRKKTATETKFAHINGLRRPSKAQKTQASQLDIGVCVRAIILVRRRL